MTPISGGTVLVTGATRGIGRAVTDAILGAGGRVIAVARDGEALAAQARASAGRLTPMVADLTDSIARERLVARAIATVGAIDGAVQAAGAVRYQGVLDVGEKDLRVQVELNFVAPFLIARDLAHHMVDRGRGSVVLVASTLAVRPAENTAAYAATKAALVSMTRSFALELAPRGVRFNAVLPGVVDTDMIRGPRPGVTDVVRTVEELARLHPMGRLGRSDEVAAAIVHLLDAPFTTGASLAVDGGLLLA
jgi:NAD(P)-dependent dehydrogenase (short-subunit alcohol dehydrogenase family)